MDFRGDIQGLRAVAVILVFIFHLNSSFLPGGFIGVDIFFVISGYLMSKIILHKKDQKQFNFIDFYISRAKRIVPVFWFLLIMVIIIGAVILIPSDISLLRKNIFWTFLFNSNNYYANLDSYFGVANKENPLLHTWTLSIEMQFYFILPLLLIFVSRKKLLLVVTLIIILLISYSLYNTFYINNSSKMYFSLLARIPEFLIGTIFAIKEKDLQLKLKNILPILSISGVLGIIITAIFLDNNSVFPGVFFLIPCLSTGFVLITRESIVNEFLSNKVFVYLGELSYSIYLWHWTVMAFVRYYFMSYEFSMAQTIMVIVVTLFLSYLSFTYVENFYRKLNNKLFFKNIFLLLCVFLLLFFSVFSIGKFFNNIPTRFSQPELGIASHANTFEKVETFGAPKKISDSILLIGDSHGLVFKGFLNTIGLKNNFNFKTITNNTYPNIPGIDRNDFLEKRYFDQYSTLIASTDKEIKKSKYIILGTIWNKDIKSLPVALNRFINTMNSDQKLLILSDFPSVDKSPIRANRGIVKNKNVNPKYNIDYKEIPANISDIIVGKKNVFVINLDYLKFRDLPFINDTIAYYDKDHLNNYGAEAMARYLEKDFMNQFNKIRKNAEKK